MTDEMQRRWANGEPKQRHSCEYLLNLAAEQWRRFHANFVGYLDSLPVPESEEDIAFEELREKIATFVQLEGLQNAAKAAHSGSIIIWKDVARWEDLAFVRDGLDKLPHPKRPGFVAGGKTLRNKRRADGPCEPFSFRFRGEVIPKVRSMIWRLLDYLWTQPNRKASFGDLAKLVWDNHNKSVSEAIGSLRRHTNAFFKNNNLPYRMETKDRTAFISDWKRNEDRAAKMATTKIKKKTPRKPSITDANGKCARQLGILSF